MESSNEKKTDYFLSQNVVTPGGMQEEEPEGCSGDDTILKRHFEDRFRIGSSEAMLAGKISGHSSPRLDSNIGTVGRMQKRNRNREQTDHRKEGIQIGNPSMEQNPNILYDGT